MLDAPAASETAQNLFFWWFLTSGGLRASKKNYIWIDSGIAGVKAHVVADVHRALVQDDDASGGLRGIGNLVLS